MSIIKSLLFRHLDNGYHDNIKRKMAENLLQLFAILTIDGLHPVSINVYAAITYAVDISLNVARFSTFEQPR